MSHNTKQILLFILCVLALWLSSKFGFFLSLGIVASVLFHEIGHAYYVLKTGGKVKGIYMIPFGGGVCLHDGSPTSRYNNAKVLLGGPLFGLISGFFVYGIYLISGSSECLKLANIIGIINVFNLIPMANILDGGQLLSTTFSCFSRNGYKYGQYLTFGILVLCVIFFLSSNIVISVLLMLLGAMALRYDPPFLPEFTNAKTVAVLIACKHFALFLTGIFLIYITARSII